MKTDEEIAKEIFDNVNRWLEFAEMKNGALIAFNIAIIAAIWSTNLLARYLFLESAIIVLFIISSIIILSTFWPHTNSVKVNTSTKNVTDNLLYFEHIAKYTKDEYLLALVSKYFQHNNMLSNIVKDYAEEIVINSKIIIYKQERFKKSVRLNAASLFVLILAVIIA